MKTIFMGTPEFAIPSLEVVFKNTDLQLIFTKEDKVNARGNKIIFSPVKQFGIDNNVEVIQPKKMRDEELIVKLSDGRYKNTTLGNEKLHEVIDTLNKNEEYFNASPIENALADLDFTITKLENTNEENLKKYDDTLMDLSKRLKKVAVTIYSKDDEKN